MSNKFKVKKKLISIALALVLAAQPLASLPMNVFAGTGKNGMLTAPLKADLKELNYGQQVTSKYIVQKSVDFSDKKVLSARIVQAPGIVYAKEKIGNLMRDVYIIADINGMLKAAAAKAARNAANAARNAANAAGNAGSAAAAARDAASATPPLDAVTGVIIGAVKNAFENTFDYYFKNKPAREAAEQVIIDAVQGAINDAFKNYIGALSVSNDAKKACNAAKTALEKGLNLESKLKIAYMAYKLAENIWSQLGNNTANLETCQKNANALKEVIDRVYSDPVGDIEKQAAKVTLPQGGVG